MGGSIAVQLSQLRKERKKKKLVARSGASRNVSTKDQVVVIGASNFDFTAKINSPQILVSCSICNNEVVVKKKFSYHDHASKIKHLATHY